MSVRGESRRVMLILTVVDCRLWLRNRCGPAWLRSILLSMLTASLMGVLQPTLCFGQAQSEPLEWHVATTGDDSNSGGGDTPFATIERALDELARRRAASDQRDASIVVHEGTYPIARPLKIEPRHSSPSGSLTIRAADGGRPVISGGRVLTGWNRRADGTLSRRIDEVAAGRWTFRELFVNAQRRPRARHPNAGYLRVEESAPDRRTGFQFAGGDIPPAVTDAAELVFLHDWSISRVGIRAIDHGRRKLTAGDPIGVAGDFFSVDFFEPHPRYFLENHPALLDAPGEWHLDERIGVLLYRPLPDETAESLQAVAPRLAALAIVRGSDKTPVRNVHFRGITFAHASWPLPPRGYAGLQATVYENRDRETGDAALGEAAKSYPPGSPERDVGRAMAMIPAAVNFELAEDCSVVDCHITHIGMSGVAFGSRTRRCRLEGCLIDDIAANGVNLGENSTRLFGGRTWWQAAPDQAASEHVVTNNRIQHGGKQFFGAVGIWVGIARNVRVAHNEICDQPYTGISLGWMWNAEPTPMAGNVIESNHIHHVMQALSDGGGIYTLGRQPGSSLVGNHIHDVPVNLGRAESNGMFLDEGTDQFTIAGNLIYRTARSPLRYNMAGASTVRDNVLIIPDGSTPSIRYNLTDPGAVRQIDNAVVEQPGFDAARYHSIIDAAGPRQEWIARLDQWPTN